MSDLLNLSLTQARAGLENKDFSAKELTQSYIKAQEETRDLGAYVREVPEKALEMAAQSDEKLAKGEGGRREGLPPWD